MGVRRWFATLDRCHVGDHTILAHGGYTLCAKHSAMGWMPGPDWCGHPDHAPGTCQTFQHEEERP